MSGKKLIDARENGNLWWLRPDGKQVTIEYARTSWRRSLKLCGWFLSTCQCLRFGRTPQRVRLTSTAEDRGADCRRTRTTGRGRDIGPDHSPEVYLREYHRPNRRVPVVVMQRQVPNIQTVQKTVEVPQVQFLDRVVDVPVGVVHG